MSPQGRHLQLEFRDLRQERVDQLTFFLPEFTFQSVQFLLYFQLYCSQAAAALAVFLEVNVGDKVG